MSEDAHDSESPISKPPTPGIPPPPGQPPAPGPVPAVLRAGKYAFSTLLGGSDDWWQINDTEQGYAVVSVQASLPHAERIARFAWGLITDREQQSDTK